MSNRLILTNFYNFDSIYFSLPFFKITSIGCTCKACAASSSEKINIDFVCEIVNFGSPNLIILKKKVKEYNKISQYFHNIFIFRIRIDILFYFIWGKCYIHNIFRTNSKWQVIISFKLITLLLLFSKHLFSVVIGHSSYSASWINKRVE